jgi:phosphoadenosine phosphosulfate reductase
MNRDPYEVVRRASCLFREVLVPFSGGKDSLAALNLCWQHFDKVEAFYCYVIPGLSFVEDSFARCRQRYPGLVIHQVPGATLSDLLRSASFRHPTAMTLNLPSVKYKDCEAYARKLSGIEWCGGGHKITDSLERRGMIQRCDGIDRARKRFYPLAQWTNGYVFRYLRRQRIPLSADHCLLGGSWDGTLTAAELRMIRDAWPEDFAKIKEMFPLVDSELKREAWYGEEEARRA